MFCSVLTNRRLRAIKNCILKLILGSQHPVVYSFFCANKGIAQRAELHSGLLYRRSAVLCYCAVFFRQPAEETMVVWQPNYGAIAFIFCASVLVSLGGYLYCNVAGLVGRRGEAIVPQIIPEEAQRQPSARQLDRPVADVRVVESAPGGPNPQLTTPEKVYNWFWFEGHGWPVPEAPAGVEIVVMFLTRVIVVNRIWGREWPAVLTEKVVPKPLKPEGEGLYQGRRPEESRGLVLGFFLVWLARYYGSFH